MIKIWGRKTSSNVQKAMWAVGELKLEHQRIDMGLSDHRRIEATLSLADNVKAWQLESDGKWHRRKSHK